MAEEKNQTVVVDFTAYANETLMRYSSALSNYVGATLVEHDSVIDDAMDAIIARNNPLALFALTVDPHKVCIVEHEMVKAFIFGLAAKVLDMEAHHGWPLNENLLKFLQEEFQNKRAKS